MAAFAVSAGVATAVCVTVFTIGILGGVSVLLAAAVGSVATYVVASLPKRSLERSALLQAKESPELAASAAVYLQSTGSRSRTILMLHSQEPRLAGLVERAKKYTLLGLDASAAFAGSEAVRADSTAAILAAVTRAQGEKLADGGEELDGMVRASLASEETKFPIFLTVSFFLPIMLMLLVAVGHHDGAPAVLSLAAVEVLILDLVLSFASAERKRLSE
jgi:hypothetical protein